MSAPRIPRPLAIAGALFTWLVIIPLAHAGVPYLISRFGVRNGWSAGQPGWWNWLGLILATAAAVLLLWVLAAAIARTPERVELKLPSFLMLHGPYAFTRNPMYVGELSLWFAWSVFFGSFGIFSAALALTAAIAFIVVPRE